MMTLGGIAASIGLVIDNAIVVVEAMCVKIAAGRPRLAGIQEAIGEILYPLIGSTLTPVVVFIPLAFLTGIAGVFFRALALTMVVSLLDVAGAGADAHAVAGRVVHPRPRKNGARPRAEGSGRRIPADAGHPDLRIRRARGAAALLADHAGVRRWSLPPVFSFTSN